MATSKKRIRDDIEKFFIDTFGENKEIWQPEIEECLYVGQLLQALKSNIKNEGLITIDRYHQKRVNPCLEYYNRLLPKYISLLSELGLSPKMYKKLITNDGEEEDDINSFINELTSEPIS